MKSLENKKYPKLASQYDCTDCMACVAVCYQNALQPILFADGHEYIKLDESKCVGCKQCENVCIKSRENYGNNDLNASKIYAAWSENQNDRKNATSGGVFGALAKYVLKKGGIVIGASLEGRECKHIMISTEDEIWKLQGSKYMASSMEGVYSIIEQHIDDGLVLFSGVGCQCAGVLSYFERHKNRNNLYTVDLICGGIPSKILIDKFYEHFSNVDNIISFREKDKYLLKVSENGRIKTIQEKSLPLHGFNCGLTNRYSCYHCQFACAHRRTDITIGDLWNYAYMKDEHAKGISTVLIHTEKGNRIINSANIILNKISWNDCIKFCKRIVYGETPIFKPRIKLVENASKMSYSTFKKLYCMDIRLGDVGLFMFRAYRYVVLHLYSIKFKYYIKCLEKKYMDNTRNS